LVVCEAKGTLRCKEHKNVIGSATHNYMREVQNGSRKG